ncbi:hypothetical protein ACYF6T_38065 [Streptomyces sp. 7R007]
MKRAALAATASALSLTAVLTGCSGSDSPDAKPTGSGPGFTTAAEKRVSPAQRLAQLVITDADASGKTVKKLSTEYLLATSQDEVTLDKAVCAPLAYAMNQLPLGTTQASLTRSVVGGYGSAITYITLASYDTRTAAESAMSGLSKAIESCGGGFTAKGSGGTSTYDSVTAEKPVATAGDASLAFRSTMTFRGVPHTLHTEAVRSGDLVAVYFAVNGTAIADSRPSDAKLPTAIVKAQNAKLA